MTRSNCGYTNFEIEIRLDVLAQAAKREAHYVGEHRKAAAFGSESGTLVAALYESGTEDDDALELYADEGTAAVSFVLPNCRLDKGLPTGGTTVAFPLGRRQMPTTEAPKSIDPNKGYMLTILVPSNFDFSRSTAIRDNVNKAVLKYVLSQWFKYREPQTAAGFKQEFDALVVRIIHDISQRVRPALIPYY